VLHWHAHAGTRYIFGVLQGEQSNQLGATVYINPEVLRHLWPV
jgi:hypothetical protein